METPEKVDDVTSINVLVATRKRPEKLKSSIESLISRAKHPQSISFSIAIDDDDSATRDYLLDHINPWLDSLGITYLEMEFGRLGYGRLHEYYNALALESASDWLIFWNDDAAMVSQHWDSMIRKYDGQFLCLAFDTHNAHPYSIWPIIPSEWTRYLGTASNHHMYDAVISQIAYLLDIMQRTDIKADHLRFDLIGEEPDETYLERTIFEGNPQDHRDVNHADNIQWRSVMAEKLALLLKEKNISTEWWESVKQGKQDPWEKLQANDVNGQMTTYRRVLSK